MITLRRITQVLSFCFFTTLIILTAYPLAAARWIDFYPRLSSHLLIATMLNTLRDPDRLLLIFLPALIVLTLTPLAGRFFCGWVCPMGITLDITDRLLKRHKDNSREPLKWKPLKYYLLILILIAAYFEANLYGWLDPLSLVTRTFTLVFYPIFEFLGRTAFDGIYPARFLRPAVEPAENLLRSHVFAQSQPHAVGLVWLFLIFSTVLVLVFVNRRFWCRFLCPLGAMLALASWRSAYGRVVSDECNSCGRCVRRCRMGAIGEDGRRNFPGECVECFTCMDVCPEGAVSFRFRRERVKTERVNLTRRGVAGGIAGAALAAPVVRLSFANPERGDSHIVRPPGVWDEERFLQECIRCGECMKVCPTNGLQPSWFEAGLEGMWTPRLVSRIGYCEFNCTMCGQACTTNAIQQLTLREKHHAVIGTAKFDKNRCIPWAENEDCIVCEEHCPVPEKAIRLRKEEVLDDKNRRRVILRPYMVEEECIGCGICENKCPVPGQAAIRVTTVKPRMKKFAGGRGGRGGGLGRFFPRDEIPPWKPSGKPAVFIGERLFDFIDGAAEKYFEFGFVRAATLEYRAGGDSTTVDIFEMTDRHAARRIYDHENPPGMPVLNAGSGGAISDYQAAFDLNRFYVKITCFSGGDPKPVLKQFASSVEKNVAARSRSRRRKSRSRGNR